MNVSPPTAYQLLESFSQLEFRLKKVPKFINGEPDKAAKVEWSKVSQQLAQLASSVFLDHIPDHVRTKMLTDGNRPKKQLVEVHGQDKRAVFKPWPLPTAPAPALLEASQRVRNNLFHGGKEDPDEQPSQGDDQEWVDAAIVVVDRLLMIAGRDLS